MTQQGLTNKEAIERLKCMRLFMQINDKDSTSKFLDEDYVANDMAVKALEKQISKKVIVVRARNEKEGVSNGDYVHYKCPNCEKKIGSAFHYPPNEYMMEHKFCDECGQRLDWSDTD